MLASCRTARIAEKLFEFMFPVPRRATGMKCERRTAQQGEHEAATAQMHAAATYIL
jgi:hypothetical protein